MEQPGPADRNPPPLSRHQSSTTETKRSIPILNPALFIPLQIFPPLGQPTTVPQTPEEHLQLLISNLLAQHETVKQNLLTIATLRAKEIRKQAQAELDALPASSSAFVSNGHVQQEESVRKGIEETMRKMRAHPKPGARSEDFELKPTPPNRVQPVSATSAPIEGAAKPFTIREGGRVVKSASPAPERTAAAIRAETAKKMRELVDNSVMEIEEYEKDAENHVDVYRALLEKERLNLRTSGLVNDRKLPTTGSPMERPMPPKGILTNFTPTPVDVRAYRKMSAGSPAELMGGGLGGKQKIREDLQKEEEARLLAQMEAKAAAASNGREMRERAERVERAERDRVLQEVLALQDELWRHMTPEEMARVNAATRR